MKNFSLLMLLTWLSNPVFSQQNLFTDNDFPNLLNQTYSVLELEKLNEVASQIQEEFDIEVLDVSKSKTIFNKTTYTLYLNGAIAYTDEQFKQLYIGNVLDLNNKFLNLSEEALNEYRKVAIKQLDQYRISYTSPNNKNNIYIFTDVNCPYCKEVHESIAEYLKQGINVHYLPLPLSEADTLNYANMKQVWCEKDKNKAFNLAIENKLSIQPNCDFNLEKIAKFASTIGVNVTPTFVLDSGSLFEGVIAAEEIVDLL